VQLNIRFRYQEPELGVQEVGIAGTAGTGQTTFDWTKYHFDDKIIGHIMARVKKSCLIMKKCGI
jgi:hypothetical protein